MFENHVLYECKSKKIPVILFLMSGFQIRGTITAYDNAVIVVASDGKTKMIYKHAVSTIEVDRIIFPSA